MKKVHSKVVIKKILLSIVLVIMLGNFVMPNRVQAISAGDLAQPIFQFITWLGDIVLEFMQQKLAGEQSIELLDNEYAIKYSPGIIFSGEILAFDINFIDPKDEETHTWYKKNLPAEKNITITPGASDVEYVKVFVTNLIDTGYSGDDKNYLDKGYVLGDKANQSEDKKDAAYYKNEAKYDITAWSKNGTPSKKGITLKEFLQEAWNLYSSDYDKNKIKINATEEAMAWDNTEISVRYITAKEQETGQYIHLAISSETRYDANLFVLCGIGEKPKLFNTIMKYFDTSVQSKFVDGIINDAATRLTQDEKAAEISDEEYYKKLASENKFTLDWAIQNQYKEWTDTDGNKWLFYLKNDENPIFSKNVAAEDLTETITLQSPAKVLQGTVATWYKGLRILSLVGLLSVLVYIGIRIIIGSTAGDKAKYKSMLMNWVAAICIVFILHYVMVFILNISQEITEIFTSTAIGTTEEGARVDKLLSNIRGEIDNEIDKWDTSLGAMAGSVICYVALVILTVIFTIQYFKRVVYMAFLTMIAPLIALTYPIDKLKDGKAQAFGMWLKEYIFNALLQPVHLLLYCILVGIAADFAIENPIYAIVAIGFLVPAEKFFRKMFGLESQTSVGTLGAAAGGAMVMNMLNKLKGNESKEKEQAQPKVRTANNGVTVVAPQGGTSGNGSAGNGAGGNGPAGNGPGGVGIAGGTLGGSSSSGSGLGGSSSSGSSLGGSSSLGSGSRGSGSRGSSSLGSSSRGTSSSRSGLGGTSSSRSGLGGTSLSGSGASIESALSGSSSRVNSSSSGNSSSGNNLANVTPVAGQSFTRGVNALADKYIYGKGARRNIRRTITGAAGGLIGATIGLAAGVATGDLGNAFQYGIGGAVAGAAGAANLGENIWSGAKSLGRAETFKKGYMGTEAYNNQQFDKQFFKSEEYKILEEKYGKDIKKQAQGYLDRGITDSAQMRKMIEKGVTPEVYSSYAAVNLKDADIISKLQTAGKGGNPITPEEYKGYTNVGVRDIDKISDLAKEGIGAEEYKQYENAGISNVNKIKQLKKYGNAEKVSRMKKIAQNFSKDALMNVETEEDGSGNVTRKMLPQFKNFARNFGATDEEIEELWQNMQDFL